MKTQGFRVKKKGTLFIYLQRGFGANKGSVIICYNMYDVLPK